MNGEEALVRAIRGAADRWYAIPGYPVTGIAAMLGAELVINEKVALEYALGDSLSGRRAAVILKNVGLNVCADPLVNATTQGLRAGVVVVAGDDVDIIASQNAQDSRYYGEVAQIPVIEPDGATIGEGVEEAFRASEAFSRVALLRITPGLFSAEVDASFVPRSESEGRVISPCVTMKGRAAEANRLFAQMFAWARRSPLNRIEGGVAGVGVAQGESRVVTVYPPPANPDALSDTRECGRPFVREHRCVIPPETQQIPETFASRGFHRTLCPDCPFSDLFGQLKVRGMNVICDIGCSVLAMNPPFEVGIATYGLGSSVGVAAKSCGVALTGDYALLHSGLNALIDVFEKGIPLLCIVLKNERMGMTGGHPSPDVLKYIRWAHPRVIAASDSGAIGKALGYPDEPTVLVIEGECPPGEEHETVEC